MARLLINLVYPLVLVGYAAIVAVCMRPYDASSLYPLFERPRGCEMPCWAGIQPGATRIDEAVTMLQDNTWVGEVYESVNAVDWVWNGSQPAFFDTRSDFFQGRMELTDWQAPNSTIASVVMQTHLTFGELWLALGQPDLLYLYSPNDELLVHVAVYSQYKFYVFNALSCTVTPDEYWNAPLAVGFGAGPNLPHRGLLLDTQYKLPDWFFRTRAPGCRA